MGLRQRSFSIATLSRTAVLGLVFLGPLAFAAALPVYVSFQEGDLRTGSDRGVGSYGTLVSTSYATSATTLRSDAAGTFQNGLALVAGNVGASTNRILLGFDITFLTNIVGANAGRIDSAALALTHDTAGAGTGSTQTPYITTAFDEQTATWNSPGPGMAPGGGWSMPCRDKSVIGTRVAPEAETWGSPTDFWGADTGMGADMLVDAVRSALTNGTGTLWLMVKRKTEQANSYYSKYVGDEDPRVNLRPELLIGIDSVNDTPLSLADYPIAAFEDEFNGAALDQNVWAVGTFDPWRTNVTVNGGMLHLITGIVGDRWQEGLIETRNYTAKYGYYETRMRLNGVSGLNNAFWLNTIDDMNSAANPYDRTEIDITEAHHNDSSSHMTLHDWAPTHISPWSSTYIVADISADFHAVGLDWRADNSLVFYWDGVARGTVTPAKFLGMDTMIPLAVLFSTKVISFAGEPGTNLAGSEMLVDYVRVWQKPGWHGSVSSSWADPMNWGLDGVPGPGWAAVFNAPVLRTNVVLSTDTYCHSLYFDNFDCPAHLISSPDSELHLGAGPAGIGGITMTTGVTNSQTIAAPIVAERPLQFGNFSRSPVASLVLNGAIDAETNGTSIQLCGFAPVLVSGNIGSNVSRVVKWGPNRARLSGTNAHAVTEIGQGSVVAASAGALASASTAVSNGAYLLIAAGVNCASTGSLILSGSGPGTGVLDIESAGDAAFSGPVALLGDVALGCAPVNSTLSLSGPVSGTGEMLKLGAGTLQFSGNNPFTGSVRIRAGSLQAAGSGALGTADAETVVENTGRLKVAGGMATAEPIKLQGAAPGFVHVENTGGTNLLSGPISLLGGGYDYGISVAQGALTISGKIAFADLYGTLRTLQLSGEGTGTISGVICDGPSAPVALRIAGPGTWTLSGANTNTGATVVNGGTLNLLGSLRSAITLSNGTFTGTGTVSNKLTVAGGTHAPGAPLGTQSVYGNYSLMSGGALRVNIRSTDPLARSGLSVQGTVSLAGSIQVAAAPDLPTNTTFVIIQNDGTDAVSGTFAGQPQTSTFFAAGYTWRIFYNGGDGNDVTLTIVSRSKPSLSMSESTGGFSLTWPDWGSAYQVRAATNLLSTTVWFPVTNMVALSNGMLRMLLPLDTQQCFFRLEYP